MRILLLLKSCRQTSLSSFDETIPLLGYDLIGQETTGIGGFFKALRTIPVIKNICDKIENLSRCLAYKLHQSFRNCIRICSEYTNVKSIGLVMFRLICMTVSKKPQEGC